MRRHAVGGSYAAKGLHGRGGDTGVRDAAAEEEPRWEELLWEAQFSGESQRRQ